MDGATKNCWDWFSGENLISLFMGSNDTISPPLRERAIAHVVPMLDPRAVRAGMLVNVFKNRDDLFYAGLEPGNVDNNSAFVLVY